MAKRGKAKGRKRKVAITRRDPEAKRQRREQREEEQKAEAADDADEPEGDFEDDEDAADDSVPPSPALPRRRGREEDDDDSRSSPPPPLPAAQESEDQHYLEGAAWAEPLARLDKKWTWLETRMLFVSLIALIGLLCLWIGIRGMQDPESIAGTTWRALFGMGVLGFAARVLTKRLELDERRRTYATIAAVVAGALSAKLWRHFGNEYFQGLLDWLQQGSSITLFGGLRGISTRLTMLVALIGASLACAAGTHINVDVVVRFVPKQWRKGAHIVAMLGAALVCLSASYGFFDFIAVSGFKAPAESSVGAKAGVVMREMGEDFFILRKQLRLDIGAVPYVLSGKKWNSDDRMNGRQWNEFLDSGFVERYGAEKVDTIRAKGADLDLPRRPFVVVPDGTAAGALLEALNLVFPIGLLMLGLRLILRVLLVVGGFLEPHLEGEGSGDDDAGGAEPEEEAA